MVFFKFRKAPGGETVFCYILVSIERVFVIFLWLSWSRLRWKVPSRITTITITVVGEGSFSYIMERTNMGKMNGWVDGMDGWEKSDRIGILQWDGVGLNCIGTGRLGEWD